MSPGIGLMKRRLETEESAISLAVSGITKKFKVPFDEVPVSMEARRGGLCLLPDVSRPGHQHRRARRER